MLPRVFLRASTSISFSLEEAIANLEKEMLVDALKNSRGNITQAAKTLKTTVRKFSYKAKRYGLEYTEFRG